MSSSLELLRVLGKAELYINLARATRRRDWVYIEKLAECVLENFLVVATAKVYVLDYSCTSYSYLMSRKAHTSIHIVDESTQYIRIYISLCLSFKPSLYMGVIVTEEGLRYIVDNILNIVGVEKRSLIRNAGPYAYKCNMHTYRTFVRDAVHNIREDIVKSVALNYFFTDKYTLFTQKAKEIRKFLYDLVSSEIPEEKYEVYRNLIDSFLEKLPTDMRNRVSLFKTP